MLQYYILLTAVHFIQGLKNLHDQDLVHLDIKPANIFIGLDGLCKIGDFGLVLDLQRVSDLIAFILDLGLLTCSLSHGGQNDSNYYIFIM